MTVKLPPSTPHAAFREAEHRIQEAAASKATSVNLARLGLTSLPECLGQLTQIQLLDLSCNLLTEIPEWLGQLTRIQVLDISYNRLEMLPESIGYLTQIWRLDLSNNKLKALPDSINQLTQLWRLDLSNNKLRSLPETINQLTQLESLDLRSNELNFLPRSLRDLKSIHVIHLAQNEGLGLPPEILEQRGTPATLLDYYFRTQQGRRPLNEAKLILVGRGGVGKTCLIKRLLHNSFDEHEPETPGIEIQPWSIELADGDRVRLHVWDFGGQEILHSTHQFFLTERTLYLLVLSGREGSQTQDAEYWLQLIKSFGGESRVLIILNKSKQHPFDVNRGLLLEKYPFIANFANTDCLDGSGIMDLKIMIRDQTDKLEHRKANFPSDWFAIKERLAEMKENFISWEGYREICRGLGERDTEAQRQLASFLHILGIALNYRDDPRLRETHVLNPRWVTEGIYTLLRSGQKARSGGVLMKLDLSNMLNTQHYPSSCYDFLLRLMERFQLCFRLPGAPERYLVPELLGENQPDIRELLDQPSLGFRYQYEVLPEGLLPRFIVQTHAHSEGRKSSRWRTGVVLEHDGCRAVVRADVRERRVDIQITGKEAQRRGLLAIIREKFDEQHRDLKGLSVDQRVPVPGEQGVTVSYRHLLTLEAEGEEWCRPEGAQQKVRVVDLLNGVDYKRPGASRHAQVFISYSHKDKKLLGELVAHLQPFVRSGLKAWSDQQIAPGSQWHKEIQLALAMSKVAVLLVSKDYLASDFIHEHELGPILQEAQDRGLHLLWVPLSACSYQNTALKNIQSASPPDKPLSWWSKAKRDAVWVEICKKIDSILTSK